MRLPLSVLFLLFSCVAPLAGADPLSREPFDVPRAQGNGAESVAQIPPAQAHAQAQLERRRMPQFELPDAGYGAATGESASSSGNGRRGGTLSAEERRALRQQINDASLDLYRSRR